MTDPADPKRELVWDLPTRIFHWALAASFTGAYLLSENDPLRSIHVMFGYTVLGLVVFRLVWGFAGSRYARFSSLSFRPREALSYLRGLATGRAPDRPGHSPAASWAVLVLLVLAAGTALTGWMQLNEIGGEVLEELHEALANAWLAMVVVHLAGVLAGSLAHRRNLAATMVTGWWKGAAAGTLPGTGQRLATGLSLAAVIVAFWGWSLAGGGPAGAVAAQADVGGTGHLAHGDDEGHEPDDD